MLDIATSRESGGIKNVAPVPVPLESILRTIQQSSDVSPEDSPEIGIHSKATSTESLQEMIIKQVEFYFSDANLTRDRFMLEHISREDGYINFEVLAAFPKMKKLSTDFEVIRNALKDSKFLELNDQGNRVKRIQPYVPKVKSKKSKSQPTSANSTPIKEVPTEGKTIYASYIPKGSDRNSIQNIFGICGNIKRIDIPVDKKTKDIKGIAFLEFETEDQAKKAIEEFNDPDNTFFQLGMRVKIYKCRNPKKVEDSPMPSEKDVPSNDNDHLNVTPSLDPRSLTIIIPESDVSFLNKEIINLTPNNGLESLSIQSPTSSNGITPTKEKKQRKKKTKTPIQTPTPNSANSDINDPFESLMSPPSKNMSEKEKPKTPRNNLSKSQPTPTKTGDKTPSKLKNSEGTESIYEKDISFNYNSSSKKKTPTTTPTSEEERHRPRFLFKREELFSNQLNCTFTPLRQPKGPLGDGTKGFAAGRGRMIIS